jgi:hypothetical protein
MKLYGQQLIDLSSMHKVGANEACEGQGTADSGLLFLSEAQQQEGAQV